MDQSIEDAIELSHQRVARRFLHVLLIAKLVALLWLTYLAAPMLRLV